MGANVGGAPNPNATAGPDAVNPWSVAHFILALPFYFAVVDLPWWKMLLAYACLFTYGLFIVIEQANKNKAVRDL